MSVSIRDGVSRESLIFKVAVEYFLQVIFGRIFISIALSFCLFRQNCVFNSRQDGVSRKR